MKRWKATMCLVAVLVLAATAVCAFDFGIDLPSKPRGFVNDYADAIAPEQEKQLENRLAQIQTKGLATITVLVVKNLNGNEISEYSINVCDLWKVGKKGADNGVLITIATDERGKNGKPGRRRIEVGRGLNGVLTDAATGRINKATREIFDRGDVGGALMATADSIEKLLAKEQAAQPPVAHRQASGGALKSDKTSDLSGILLYALMSVAVIIIMALGGNWVVKRINRNRERRQAEEIRNELIKEYENTIQTIGAMLCEAEKDVLRLPKLANAEGLTIINNMRQNRDMVVCSKDQFCAETSLRWLTRDQPKIKDLLLEKQKACKTFGDLIKALPQQLEQKFKQATDKILEFEQKIEALEKQVAAMAKEGYVLETKQLPAFENELQLLRATIKERSQHPDEIVWKLWTDKLEAISASISKPKRVREEASVLIRKNRELFADLSSKNAQAVATLSKLQTQLPQEAWQDLPRQCGEIERRFSAFNDLNLVASDANEISSGISDFGLTQAKAAGAELDAVRKTYKSIESLASEFEQAKVEYRAAFEKAEQAAKAAGLAIREDGVKESTARKFKAIESKLAEAKALVSRAASGEMINLLALMVLVAEVRKAAQMIASEASEEAENYKAEARRRARLKEEREMDDRRRNQAAVLSATADDDDDWRKSRGGGGGGITFDSPSPSPDTGGSFDGSGADD